MLSAVPEWYRGAGEIRFGLAYNKCWAKEWQTGYLSRSNGQSYYPNRSASFSQYHGQVLSFAVSGWESDADFGELMEAVIDMTPIEGAAFVAQRNNDALIIGLAYYHFDPTHPTHSPEFAIVVEDRFQGHGVGKALLKHLCRHAEFMGIKALFAFIHRQNRRMRYLLHRTEYPFEECNDGNTVEAIIHLRPEKTYRRIGPFDYTHPADLFAGFGLRH